MQLFNDLVHNFALWTALISWFVAQVFKTLIAFLVEHRFSPERMFGDGGMPSGHTATVTALAFMVGHCYGYSSAVFAVSLILCIVVSHDAAGVRRETGKQAVTIQQLFGVINDMLSERDKVVQTEKLKVLVGHTPLQVFFGMVVGLCVAGICMAIFNLPYMACA